MSTVFNFSLISGGSLNMVSNKMHAFSARQSNCAESQQWMKQVPIQALSPTGKCLMITLKSLWQ